jgi:biopolymer transport protein ExbD
MRRFSQKNALVTLADINVTPLLDLAFVLLIIFVITTPLLEQSIQLDLPVGGQPDTAQLDRRDIKTVDVLDNERYQLDGQVLNLDQIEQVLAAVQQTNPRLVVRVRADQRQPWGAVAGLLDRCERRGITRIRPSMFPER